MEQTSPAAIVSTGDKIGRYRVLGRLATGGMAEVFAARQDGPMGFSKTVVIKRILPQYATDDEFLHMFLNEARLAAMINHPNVVSIFELGEDPSSHSLFMAMEYIDGRNLREVLKQARAMGSQLPIRLAARLVSDACAGLDFAHDLRDQEGRLLNLVHRDISADNILVTYSGMVKVVDFGIAKAALTENRTRTGQVKGKFGYMAPEMLLGTGMDRRVDVWALGIVLYWLLTGHRPFRGENEGMLVNQVVNTPVPPMDRRGDPVPDDLESIVLMALSKDPAYRFQTAGEFRSALDLWLSHTGDPVNSPVVAGVMEKLFPIHKDETRLAMVRVLKGEVRDTGWALQARSSQSDPDPIQGATPTPITGSDGKPVSQVMAKPQPSPRDASRVPLYLVSGALVLALGALATAWWTHHSAELAPSDAITPMAAALPTLPAPPPSGDAPSKDIAKDKEPGVAAAAPAPLAAVDPEKRAEAAASPSAPGAKGHLATNHTRKPAGPSRGAHASEPASTAPPLVIAPLPPITPAPASPQPEEHRAAAGPPGKLAVDARPWATVFVDGSRVGMTPIDPISLPAGRHKVELVNDEIGAHVVRNVDVRSGETARLREKLTAGGE